MSLTLPIYRLTAEEASDVRLIDLAKRIFDLEQDYRLSRENGCLALRGSNQVVELASVSGYVWAANHAQLWKPSLRPELPGGAEAAKIAKKWAQDQGLLPKLAAPFRIGPPTLGGTYYAVLRDGKREDRQLDTQVAFPVFVGDLPVTGGGSDLTVTLGHQGRVIAFSGGWRQAQQAFESKVIDRKLADQTFLSLTKQMKLESFDASLAYFSAPAFEAQEFLYPVYVYRATAVFGKQRVPLRQMMLAATEFGPPLREQVPQPRRAKAARPSVRLLEKQKETKLRRTLATRALTNPFEAGTSWIGLSGGLAGSQANAQGFVDEWAAAGWLINFNWGDANAWESDWRRNDDTWVDAADFVFYTGHANQNGWVLSNPDDGFLDFVEVGANPQSPGDLWGQNDLEWAVVAACGPLQDDILAAGGGNVLSRWDGAFDGLHILMGYGAITFDNSDEGRRIAQYAKGGST
ncbi:MAG TPA: DUF6345 domain-containing protein, partial [Polyangiaceae bacterium]|nr:DUF6345 domain-containing protein [Polyangiaceae bacterium]